MGRWLRQIGFFLLAIIILLATLVSGERTFSPVFQQCIAQHPQANGSGAAEEKPSAFKITVNSYVRCTAEFFETHNGAIAALATLVIAAFTCTLWIATSRQAQLTREALIVDKRAFVFAAGFAPLFEQNRETGHYHWRFRPVWQNSGDTPTRRLRLFVDYELRNNELPPGSDFSRIRIAPGPGLLGPRATGMGGAVPYLNEAALSPHDIVDIQHGRKFFYMWGWARYFDGFPETPERITRFCWAILPTPVDPFAFDPKVPQTPTTLTFHNVMYTEGNCADEDCA